MSRRRGPSTSSTDHLWVFAAPGLAVLHVMLFAALYARPGLAGVVLWHAGPIALTAVAIAVMVLGLLRSRRSRLTWSPSRAAAYASLAIVSVLPIFYTTYPSSRDGDPSSVRFRVPLDGPVLVIWGGRTRGVNYHVIAPAERWAYDLAVTHGGRRYAGGGTSLAEYFSYGAPVLAAAAGVVRAVSDGRPDTPLGSRRAWNDACGNRVVIEVAPGEFLFNCHLQPGSIVVAPEQQVAEGQPIGRVGNSGRSTEPHLHVHLQTTIRGDLGEGIPMYFHNYTLDGRLVARGLPSGGRERQTIEHAAPSFDALSGS